uniref:Uncharacterized protein n=1 Tax=Arundo donax TaxID=35708 RepID=A0A0A9ANB7_ARUDO
MMPNTADHMIILLAKLLKTRMWFKSFNGWEF